MIFYYYLYLQVKTMCHKRKGIISDFNYVWDDDDDIYDYQEHEQNRIFVIVNQTLLVIDSTNYVRMCPHCDTRLRIYVYGEWPNVRASFDGTTDLPICAILPGVKTLTYIRLFNEPRFGKFIHVYPINPAIENCSIIYYPTRNIEQKTFNDFQNISIDGKPVVFCQTIDDKCVIINSDGEIPAAEVVYSKDKWGHVFKTGNGTLQYEYGLLNKWVYTAGPALSTKPAAISE